MAWLCNSPATTQKPLQTLLLLCLELWQEYRHPTVEPGGYKGAPMSPCPGAARSTWVPLGVLAAAFCGKAPKKTRRQQMACVIFHPAMRLPPAQGYKTLRATEFQRSLSLSQADM